MIDPTGARRSAASPRSYGPGVVQSVELLLDPALDAHVREQWQALARAGLPSLAANTAGAPHITLAAADDPFPAGVEEALPGAVADLPVAVRLGGLLLFGSGPIILVRTVTPSARLLALQARVCEAMADASRVSPLTRPDRWSPHVTLARGLRPDDLERAVTALAPLAEVDGVAVSARRWDSGARRTWPLTATG
jgi:2'-5' RNA ligase